MTSSIGKGEGMHDKFHTPKDKEVKPKTGKIEDSASEALKHRAAGASGKRAPTNVRNLKHMDKKAVVETPKPQEPLEAVKPATAKAAPKGPKRMDAAFLGKLDGLLGGPAKKPQKKVEPEHVADSEVGLKQKSKARRMEEPMEKMDEPMEMDEKMGDFKSDRADKRRSIEDEGGTDDEGEVDKLLKVDKMRFNEDPYEPISDDVTDMQKYKGLEREGRKFKSLHEMEVNSRDEVINDQITREVEDLFKTPNTEDWREEEDKKMPKK